MTHLTSKQLLRAAHLKKNIEALQKQLERILKLHTVRAAKPTGYKKGWKAKKCKKAAKISHSAKAKWNPLAPQQKPPKF